MFIKSFLDESLVISWSEGYSWYWQCLGDCKFGFKTKDLCLEDWRTWATSYLGGVTNDVVNTKIKELNK